MLIALNQTATRDEKSSDPSARPGWIRAAFLSLLFQIAFWCLLCILGLILFLPSYTAWIINQESFPVLTEMALILFLTLAVYLFFIKELAYFFALFSKISLPTSIDLGARLFRKYSFATVLFIFYASLLALLVIVLIDSLLAPIRLILPEPIRQQAVSLVGVLLFGYYSLFDQSLRLVFFRSIAAPPKRRASKEPLTKPAESAPGITPV